MASARPPSPKTTPHRTPGLIRLGKIAGAHGLGGALRFRADDRDSTALTTLRDVYLQSGDAPRRYRIVSAAPLRPGTFRIVLDGVSDISAAEALRGATLMVAESDLAPPRPGEFYYFQVLGMEVRLAGGDVLGTIEDVFFTGANDVWVVRNGQSEVLIPVIEDVVKAIDFQARRVTIEPLPGLLD